MSLVFSPVSISFMSHVDFRKWLCRPVDFKGQGPLIWVLVLVCRGPFNMGVLYCFYLRRSSKWPCFQTSNTQICFNLCLSLLFILVSAYKLARRQFSLSTSVNRISIFIIFLIYLLDHI